MADTSFVEAFYERNFALYRFLIDNKQLSFATDVNITFCRSLVLGIASFFEHEIIEIIRKLPLHHAAGNAFIVSMIEKQVIARKYHTYFDWDNRNANAFFALFGEEFKNFAKTKMREDVALKLAVDSFLELGDIRNRVVHQNFVQYDVDKTPEELIAKFRTATPFLEFLRLHLFSSPHSSRSPDRP